MPVAEMLAQQPDGDHPVRRPVRRSTPTGAPQVDPALFDGGRPGLRHLLRLPGDGRRRSAARSRAPGSREFGRTAGQRRRARARCSPACPTDAAGRGCRHGDAVAARARRASPSTRARPRRPGRRVRGRRPRGSPACSATPRCCTPSTARRCSSTSCYDIAGCRPTWTDGQHRRRAGRARSARRSATSRVDLRAVRRRRLGGRRGARAAGDRRPADLRVRRPRPAAQGRGRAGRARLRRRDRRRPARSSTPQEQFLDALAGVTDPEEKRKIIGREFIRVFEAGRARGRRRGRGRRRQVDFLVQGTLYPDVVESGGGTGTANIKSHHNVGGLPDDLQFALVEPLRTLFKDEVRAVGEQLGLPAEIVWRQPFPGPGLGIRIVGEVTRERLDILREADAIAREELTARRPRPRHLAVPGRAARRRPLGRRAGRRPHLRPPGRAAPGVQRGRDDRRLGAAAVRRARARSRPASPTRCARSTGSSLDITSKPPGHHRVGVSRA